MEFYVVDPTRVDLTINGFDATGAPSTYSYVGLVAERERLVGGWLGVHKAAEL